MKRIFVLVFIFLLIFSVFSGAAFADGQDRIKTGDMNGDGNLSVTDVVLLRKAILAGQSTAEAAIGDMNGDDALTVTDVVLLRKAILGSGSSNNGNVLPGVGDASKAVFSLVNQNRAQNGLPALSYREDLQAAADLRAEEITRLFSHTRPNGTSCFTVVTEAGISYFSLGENIAYGQTSAESVMNSWMQSQGHRENILSASFTGMAVGCYTFNGTNYWVQIFIG